MHLCRPAPPATWRRREGAGSQALAPLLVWQKTYLAEQAHLKKQQRGLEWGRQLPVTPYKTSCFQEGQLCPSRGNYRKLTEGKLEAGSLGKHQGLGVGASTRVRR